MERKGTFLDKIIYSYDPGIECTIDDLINVISRYKRIETLRLISQLSVKIFFKGYLIELEGVPITNDIVIEAALYVIKHSNDDTTQIISEHELLLLIKMCHKLHDENLVQKTTDGREILMHFGYRQFVFQEKLFNNLSRNYYLYNHLWYKVRQVSDIDILSEIESILGLPYEIALMFTYASVGNKNGYIFPYEKEVM